MGGVRDRASCTELDCADVDDVFALSSIPARTFGGTECCLEPFLSSRTLALWQKRNAVTSRVRFRVAHRSLTVHGCTSLLLGSRSVSVVDFCLRDERSDISWTRYPRSGTLETSTGLFVSVQANGFG